MPDMERPFRKLHLDLAEQFDGNVEAVKAYYKGLDRGRWEALFAVGMMLALWWFFWWASGGQFWLT
jgi:hypothetical protein